MIISYNWLCEYLPEGQSLDPEKLGKILTSIGLEVESLTAYESIPGSLQGLVIGEVMECEKHPDADKLKLTKVNIGTDNLLQIVCGAPNVEAGQKVIVAQIGTTIHPVGGEPMTMKKAKIRGVESQGMICAEDEIGIGQSHTGIIILPAESQVGTAASEYYKPYSDHIFEIGLTPNRIDAMSHLGVARDVCAYLSHQNKKDALVRSPFKNNFKVDHQGLQMEVVIENADACARYAGVSIQGVTVKESPGWLQDKLKSIGLRPINNIVDITNFILHETGQPLHAFDADQIKGRKVVVKNLPQDTLFISLDDKERKLSSEDLMICNAEEPMCIGGVYGGLHSGVSDATKNIFLESAWFNPVSIRKTSMRHGLRTDAAIRFEKGVDISNTVTVLKRAAMMIVELAGGEIASDLVDCYPSPKQKTEVILTFHYLKKLSGKNYHGDTVKNILSSLGFELIKESHDELRLAVPFSKSDVTIGADIVEEIMRIDGLDNVEIPAMITIAPMVESLAMENACGEKTAEYLSGSGFMEIFTNSITNSAYFKDDVLKQTVKMINNLSMELDVMKPDMIRTGLESIAYNINRKNTDLQWYEFGKTYSVDESGKYTEKNNLAIYITGNKTDDGWKSKGEKTDFYFLKAVVNRVMALLGLSVTEYAVENHPDFSDCLIGRIKNQDIVSLGALSTSLLSSFGIKQPVYFANIDWDKIMTQFQKLNIKYSEIPKYPAVQRDLSIVVDKGITYESVEKATKNARVNKLVTMNLFDVFVSEKLGPGKKSLAVNFVFQDEEKTMTDKEIDSMMGKIIIAYEKELNAEIRK